MMTEQRLQEIERRRDTEWTPDWTETMALIAEVRRLQAQLSAVVSDRDATRADALRLHGEAVAAIAERDAALALLRVVEWDNEDSCMLCGGLFDEKTTRYRDGGVIEEYIGHAHDCRLAALIGGTK